MRRNLLLSLIVVFVLAAGAFFYRAHLGTWLAGINDESIMLLGKSGKKGVLNLLPPPLRAAIESNNSHLTQSGTIASTNDARHQQGLGPLKENSTLDKVAERKLKDMFAQQYFEHINPQGKGPSDLADAEGYKYILIGENLALGNFKDDATLVDAWMHSPGHRANILNTKYREIGVAVGKGQYEGHETWLAVQSFGAAASICPQPPASNQTQIADSQRTIDALRQKVNAAAAQLQAYQNANDTQSYNRVVGPYNTMGNQLNNLITALKNLTNQYNAQVQKFNACLKGNT